MNNRTALRKDIKKTTGIGDDVRNQIIRFLSGGKNKLICKDILRLGHFGYFSSNPQLTPWADILRPVRPFTVEITGMAFLWNLIPTMTPPVARQYW